MFGEAELLGMKPGSFLINLTGRQAVDEAALVRSLKDGPLAGAVLSTFDYSQRELPLESELWRLPNAIVVPRIAGVGAPQWRLAIDLFASNLDRYLAGDPLANLVDKDLGYAPSAT